MLHAAAATGSAYMYVVSPCFKEKFISGHVQVAPCERLMALQAEDHGKRSLFYPIAKEAVITDLLETGREDMHHEPADELFAGNSDLVF